MTLWDLLQPCNIAPHSPHFKHINIIKDTIINNKHTFISYGTMLIHFRLKMYRVIWYPFRSLNGFNTFHLFCVKERSFLNMRSQWRYGSLLRSIENSWNNLWALKISVQPEVSLSCSIYLGSINKHVHNICTSITLCDYYIQWHERIWISMYAM